VYNNNTKSYNYIWCIHLKNISKSKDNLRGWMDFSVEILPREQTSRGKSLIGSFTGVLEFCSRFHREIWSLKWTQSRVTEPENVNWDIESQCLFCISRLRDETTFIRILQRLVLYLLYIPCTYLFVCCLTTLHNTTRVSKIAKGEFGRILEQVTFELGNSDGS
jgi:hypothetical protein